MEFDLTALDAVSIKPGVTRKLVIPDLGLTLILAPATDDNPAYREASIVNAATAAKRQHMAGGEMTSALIDANTKDEIGLFAEHVVKGWDGVKNKAGEPVPFSPEAARELLTKIAGQAARYWRQIDRFASVADNFTPRAIAAAEALAGN